MKVLLLVYYPDSLTFTLARAISRGGHEVVVNSVTEADNQWDVRMKQRLLGLPNVAFTRKLRNDPKDTYGRAVCQLHPRLMQNKKATLPDIPKNLNGFFVNLTRKNTDIKSIYMRR